MTLSGYEYNCSAGETWDSVARNVYGDEKYSADLLNANPEYVHMVVFGGGEVLRLPVVAVPDERDADLPENAPWEE